MNSIERILEYIKYKQVSPNKFEKEIGLGNGYFSIQLKRNAELGNKVLSKILEKCRDLNPSWLLLGEGEMLLKKKGLLQQKMEELEYKRKNPEPIIVAESKNIYSTIFNPEIDWLTKQLQQKQLQLKQLEKEISIIENIISTKYHEPENPENKEES